MGRTAVAAPGVWRSVFGVWGCPGHPAREFAHRWRSELRPIWRCRIPAFILRLSTLIFKEENDGNQGRSKRCSNYAGLRSLRCHLCQSDSEVTAPAFEIITIYRRLETLVPKNPKHQTLYSKSVGCGTAPNIRLNPVRPGPRGVRHPRAKGSADFSPQRTPAGHPPPR